jgi:hypothetical protein
LTATGLDANFWPTPDVARDIFVLVYGIITRERVSINKAVDDLSPIEKDHLLHFRGKARLPIQSGRICSQEGS